jgi:PTS system galactitol-specific IIB component
MTKSMTGKKKILVVCGAGVATSTVTMKKIEEKLAERGIAVQVDQCKATEVAFKAERYDLIVSTTILGEVGDVPVIRTVAFLTGVGIDQEIDRIAEALGAE